MYPLFSSIYEIYKISHDSLFTRLLSGIVKMVLASLGQDERVNLQVSFTYYKYCKRDFSTELYRTKGWVDFFFYTFCSGDYSTELYILLILLCHTILAGEISLTPPPFRSLRSVE